MDSISSFVDRKSGGGSKYNYELEPLIKDFSFLDFIYSALDNRDIGSDFGGFLVITDKQYIVGYNAGFGFGTHISSFARTFVDLKGGGDIHNDIEALKFSRECKNKYITARIMYDCTGENENRRPIYSGSLSFTLESYISQNQFEVFKKFYEDYNSEIEKVVKKLSIEKFCVWFSYKDENGKTCVNKSNNLDNLYSFLENYIDQNKEFDIDERIIGVEVNKSLKKS